MGTLTCTFFSEILEYTQNYKSTSLSRFGISEGAQHIFYVLSPQESLFRDAGHSVHSSA